MVRLGCSPKVILKLRLGRSIGLSPGRDSLSILSGAHLALTRRVAEGLKAQGAEDVVLFVGGLIPDEDIPALKEIGVKEIFTSGTSVNQVVEAIKKHVQTNP